MENAWEHYGELNGLIGRIWEIQGSLEEVIDIQSKAIDGLFRLLMMHISSDDEVLKPIVEEVNRAAMIRRELG